MSLISSVNRNIYGLTE